MRFSERRPARGELQAVVTQFAMLLEKEVKRFIFFSILISRVFLYNKDAMP